MREINTHFQELLLWLYNLVDVWSYIGQILKGNSNSFTVTLLNGGLNTAESTAQTVISESPLILKNKSDYVHLKIK